MHAGNESCCLRRLGVGAQSKRCCENWEWLPRHCELQDRFRCDHSGKEAMCAALRGVGVKHMLVVGDSLSFHHLETMLCPWTGLKPAQSCLGEGLWQGAIDCNGRNILISYARSDCLATPQFQAWLPRDSPCGRTWQYHPNSDIGRLRRCGTQLGCTSKCLDFLGRSNLWWELLQGKSPPDLLLVNVGAHLHNATEYQHAVKSAAEMIRRSDFYLRGGLVVVRNTPPGHTNWKTAKTPFSPAEIAADIALYTQNGSGSVSHLSRDQIQKYSLYWGAFSEFNKIIERHLVDGLGGHLLDADSATRLRPDGHRDPLHYHHNHPAVMLWTDLLLQLLLEIRMVANGRNRSHEH